MQLKALIKSVGLLLPKGFQDFEVKGITSDSRKVQDRFIFVAVKGRDFDGHSFIKQAIQQGAKAVVDSVGSSQSTVEEYVAYLKVADTRRALAELVAHFYGQPSMNLKVVGITGTNGKTTVSYLIEAILKSAQFNPAVIGTINYRFKDRILNASNTTPGSEQLQSLLVHMQKDKVDYVIIEVSSHALDQARVEAVRFSTAIFTNLTRDHLDYHGNLNSYFVAKSRLFTRLSRDSFAILNMDDTHTPKLLKLTKARIVTYGLGNRADISAQDISFSLKGSEFLLRLSHSSRKIITVGSSQLKMKTPLIGKHNLYNILAAVTFGLTQRIDPDIISQAVGSFAGVPGRLERIPTKSNFSVFVDYAHTEDALRNVIMSLRPLCKGRLCVVFGCGGSRDKSKRPKMGRVVSELADAVIVTTDNPRNEEPEEIVNDIVAGINKQNFRKIINREEAIKEALSFAGKNDIILIAGKGHEDHQIFKDRTIRFDDREVVRRCLELKR